MNIGLSNTAALFGAPQTSSNPSIFDVVTGNASGTSGILQSTFIPPEPAGLTSQQESSLQGLSDFVKENVAEGEQEALLESIDALETLLSSGNDTLGLNTDPAFALLAANPFVLGSSTAADAGLLVDQLI